MNSYPHKTVLSTRRSLLLVASYFFLTLGICGVGYASYAYLDARHYQAVQMKKFVSSAPHSTASTPSAPRVLVEGDVLGELQVPRLRLNTIVVQGESHATLRRAVGHLADSAMPGEWGNVTLAGHRDTFFRPLRDIRVGDEIRFNTHQRSFEYRVDSIDVVGPNDVGVLKSSTGHELTLLTCYPIYYVGPAPKRLIVRAREVESSPQEQSASRTTGTAPNRDSTNVNF